MKENVSMYRLNVYGSGYILKVILGLSSSPGPSPNPPRRGLVHTVCACAVFYLLGTYTNSAGLFHANERESCSNCTTNSILKSILFKTRTSATTTKNETLTYIQRYDVTRHAQTGLSAGGNT